MKRILIITLTALILAGCGPTAAQKQAATIRVASQQAKEEAMACFADVYNNPEYASIVSRIPSPTNVHFTMAQLADDSFPTKKESELLISLHDDSIPCKEALLSKIETILPPLATLDAEEMVASDELSLKLVKRKITWGEYNQRRREFLAEYRKKAMPIFRHANAQLIAENQNELAQRQAIIDGVGIFAQALVNWSECRHAGVSLESCGSSSRHGHHQHVSSSHEE